MKKLLLFLCLFLSVFTGISLSAVTPVQTVSTSCAAVTTTCPVTITATTAGNFLTVLCGISATGRTVTASDTNTDTFAHPITQLFGGAGSTELHVFTSYNIAAGSTTVNCNFSGGSLTVRILVREYPVGTGLTKIAVGNPVDKTASAGGNGTSLSSGSTATTTQADELVVGFHYWSASRTATAGSGFGNLSVEPSGGSARSAMEDKIVSATGTQLADVSLSSTAVDWASAVITLNLGTAADEHCLLTMGVSCH